MKVITSEIPILLKKKGCDASNIYDEEIPEKDREFSDDEKEREFKKLKKMKKNAEEGEIIELNKKRKLRNTEHQGPKNNKRPMNFKQEGAQIPMYTTNYSANMQ